jgi:hypothetical protein
MIMILYLIMLIDRSYFHIDIIFIRLNQLDIHFSAKVFVSIKTLLMGDSFYILFFIMV